MHRRTKRNHPSTSVFDITYVSVPQQPTEGSLQFQPDEDHRIYATVDQVIVFGIEIHEALSFRTIYKYFDDVQTEARVLSTKYPNALLLWDNSVVVETLSKSRDDREGGELQLLSDFLTLRHVLQGMGILVTSLPLSQQQGKVSEASDALLRWQLSHVLEHMATHKLTSVSGGGASLVNEIVRHQHVRLQAATPASLHTRCATLLYTRKYDPQCHPPQTLQYPLLVTGLGGAGTHFVAKRLSAEGWRVRHEEIGADGAVVRTSLAFCLFS
jgi:hypothetical protein